jgi:hypothetical protein
MHGNFRVVFRLTRKCGELRGFDDGAVRDFAARVVAYHDVCAGIIGGVKPEVVGARKFECHLIVFACAAPDDDLEAIRRAIAARAGNVIGRRVTLRLRFRATLRRGGGFLTFKLLRFADEFVESGFVICCDDAFEFGDASG